MRFSRRWSTDEVPGISKILGERCSSHASATCSGVAFRAVAVDSRADDCSGLNPPNGKNGV